MLNRPLSTILSLVLLTLGVGMISLILQINRHVQDQMNNNLRDIDMVVGAKGSPLQLILSAVYHIDAPTGNIALQEAEKLSKNRLIESAIPLAYGDSYEGFRIVGTNHNYPQLYRGTLEKGRLWQAPFEVTVGAKVAQRHKLELGDTFSGSHGLAKGGERHDEHQYKIVGILDASNAVIDQLILTAVESVWQTHHHDESRHEEGGHKEHEDEKEITAMLIRFRSPLGIVQLPRMVNETTNMQAAVPSYEIGRLFNLMGVGIETLSGIAISIMIVSGLSIFISLFSALKEREYEMALMRAYGATRWQLVWLVLQEGMLLSFFGLLFGLITSRVGLWFVYKLVENNYYYSLSDWVWLNEEWWLLAIALAIGLIASLIPAVRVFNINISKTLADV